MSAAASVSLGVISHVLCRSDSGSGADGAGAGSRMTGTPAAAASWAARTQAGTGTSSCRSSTEAEAISSPWASTSSGVTSALAPATTTIRFWPDASTVMTAVPVPAAAERETPPVATPSCRRLSRSRSPNASCPTRPTIATGVLRRRRGHRLVGPLSTGELIEPRGEDRLARRGRALRVHHQVQVQTPNHHHWPIQAAPSSGSSRAR